MCKTTIEWRKQYRGLSEMFYVTDQHRWITMFLQICIYESRSPEDGLRSALLVAQMLFYNPSLLSSLVFMMPLVH
ncbi:hypothetical protein ATANTOWER_027019 [Ataeniobius toweri]|uniref:Uncharacterized protein n=1 Tax=Ataeniobius toweri TaxID=208326 RepID=A0ABU7C3T6_9TELE|nr:hypothetical protein [Ataeniobius toweri]